MPRPLEITTTTHAIAVSIYFLQSIQGMLYIVGLAQAVTMTAIAGPAVVGIWSLILVLGGALAALATRAAKKNPMPALKVEMWAIMALVVANLWYEATLVIGNGPLGVVTTQSYAIMLVVGCAARIVQIRKERKRILAALKRPHLTPVIADEEGK